MKKLVCSLVILTSVVAFAAQEKVGTIQIDNMTGLAKSCTKLGDMLGNPMASSVVTGALANNSSVKYFGPMRADAGVSVVLGLYLDAAKLGCTNENDEVMAFTVVYPVVGGKAKFLKLHQDAKEQDGVVRVDDDEFTAFSADGKWATKAKTAALAKAALADVELAQKRMGGDAARIRVNKKGLNALAEAIDKAVKEEKSADWLKPLGESIKGATAAVGALKVSDSGIDFNGSLKAASDSALAKFGKTSLGANPLKFAAKDAVYARATAPGGTLRSNLTVDDQMKLVFKLIKDIGVDIDKFLSYAVKGDDLRIVGDVKSAIDYFKGAETNGLKAAMQKKTDDKDFMERLMGEYSEAANKKLAFEPCTRALNLSFAIKGYAGSAPLSERFAATLPEAAAKKPFDCSFLSYVSVANAIVPAVIASLDEEERAMVQPLLAQLPKERKGGMASVAWREGDTFKLLCRISADEVKGIGAAVNVGMSFAMMQAMKGASGAAGSLGDEDDVDEEEVDDDDED